MTLSSRRTRVRDTWGPEHGVVGPGRSAGYRPAVRTSRRCSRAGCSGAAVATLTYVYADSTAVVGPLATVAEPHTYDLCGMHAVGLTAPKGWELVRPEGEYGPPQPTGDDLSALADAVREAARPAPHVDPPVPSGPLGRRGHLRALPTPR